MKKIVLISTLLFVLKFFGQNNTLQKKAYEFQQQLNKEFLDSVSSPLERSDFKKFKSLNFFPINDKYIVKANFFPINEGRIFEMTTTTDRRVKYKVYGVLRFEIDGVKEELFVYQNLELMRRKGFEDYLFLPFKDKTNGIMTYGGGRYLEMRIPKTQFVLLDFNQAYNPYCAYNEKYSCPLVPYENTLSVAIPAGVKKFHD
ncbi:DUF1684 domain-containing protein [Flavobacterium oreochromis]|uniref:DUF1684 domain-containing protein n=1 Tax=Flavobacterium columnare TaxID=996 RepID=A0A246GA46_9FLAO|nr:DUF1684 domain-containing protein [Flavobacterium oreochromis]OWP76738.1 hypothetical protein BWK62_08890 [Flavobacterium oreochromis]POR21175.1 hypothetical protein BWK58_12790 [Flavobacterium columnare]QYS85905.1 DUF1684 domain-containing protein [Flavobacterium oreochromis]